MRMKKAFEPVSQSAFQRSALRLLADRLTSYLQRSTDESGCRGKHETGSQKPEVLIRSFAKSPIFKGEDK